MTASRKQEASLALPLNYTPFPHEYTDILMPMCRPNEWMVLSHIMRRTEGWHKQSDAISVNQFVEATGMSATAVRTALKALQARGIIAGLRQVAPNGGTLATRYHITIPVARQGDPPQDTQEAPTPAAPTPMQKTQPHDKDILNTSERNPKEIMHAAIEARETSPQPIIAALVQAGFSYGAARSLALVVIGHRRDLGYVKRWIAEAHGRKGVTNTQGFITAMVRENADTKTPPSPGGGFAWADYDAVRLRGDNVSFRNLTQHSQRSF